MCQSLGEVAPGNRVKILPGSFFSQWIILAVIEGRATLVAYY